MSIAQLQVHFVRNIISQRLSLHPRFNFIVGANGQGKTSLLEAIYLLGTGHSFRTREISPLIHHEHDSLTVFAKTTADDTLSIQKSKSGPTRVRLNQEACYSSSELARFLPCQVIYQDIFQIMDAGSAVRRSLLDWGLFHVKPQYHLLWKEYRRALKHRNALLRQGAPQQQFTPWNKVLADLGSKIHDLRCGYFSQWAHQFNLVLKELTQLQCRIHYEKGWDKKNSGRDLLTVLEQHLPQDRLRQSTLYGPHRADISFDIELAGKAKQLLSRGQQKMILIALKLAQIQLLNQPCIMLMDDISAELDQDHLSRLLHCLGTIESQFFITTIKDSILTALPKEQTYEIFYLDKI